MRRLKGWSCDRGVCYMVILVLVAHLPFRPYAVQWSSSANLVVSGGFAKFGGWLVERRSEATPSDTERSAGSLFTSGWVVS